MIKYGMPVDSRTSLLAVTYIAAPTLMMELGGLRLLTDPTFNKGGSSYKKLQKLTGPAIRPEKIGPIDLVLLSHDEHPDNLDTSGRALLTQARLVLTTPEAAARLGG